MFAEVLKALSDGFLVTLQIFAFTLLGALPLGLIIAFGSMSRFLPLKGLVKTIVWIIRGTPLMLQLIAIYYGPGLITGNNMTSRGSACGIYYKLRLLLFRNIPWRNRKHFKRSD